ncbi:hypothetical protein Tco_1014221 [Tanacetum coccineum]
MYLMSLMIHSVLKIESLERRVKKLEKNKKKITHKLKRLYKVGLSARVISSDDEEPGEGRNEEMMFDAEKDLAGEEVVVEKVVEEENLNEDKITVAQTLQMLKSIPKAKGVTISEPSDTQRPIILKQKNLDKGKAKMIEPEKPLKRKDQILLDEQEARRLQTIFDEEARMLMDKRKKHFAAKRAKEKRSKPPTKAQKRKTMSTYLKNMAAIDSKVLEGPSKRAGDELEKEAKKKQKIDDEEEIAKLQALIKITPDEEEVAVNVIPLASKPLVIVNYSIYKEGRIGYKKITRADRLDTLYRVFSQLLHSFDREDLETLWKLVKARHGETRPTKGYKRVL